MGKVRVHMMISADGYTAGPNQRLDSPFGDGMDEFLGWVFELQSFQAEHTDSDAGVTGPSNDVMREAGEGLGATIMGRNMFGGGHGPWPEETWNGWWGDNPPYHTPVFVLTHAPRDHLVMEGGTTFYFVTDGIEVALRQAQEAAGDLDVRIGGGADVVNQYLAAGLVDELELHVVPFLFGGGTRLFEGLGDQRPELKIIRTVPSEKVTHIKYRVVK